MDHGVGGGEVQAHAPRLEADEQDGRAGVVLRLELPHHRAALAGRRLAREGEVGQGQSVQQLGSERQHFGELREHQHASALIDQGGQHVGQQFELGAFHRLCGSFCRWAAPRQKGLPFTKMRRSVGALLDAFHQARVAADLTQFQ